MLLGVYIQPDLKWSKQVSELKNKLKKRLAGLNMLRSIFPYSTMKTIAQGIFMSMLAYCLPVFGGCDKTELNTLQVLQNRAAKIVTRAPNRTSRVILYDNLEWLTIHQMIAYHTVMNIYKIRTTQKPSYLSQLLNKENKNGNISVGRRRSRRKDM